MSCVDSGGQGCCTCGDGTFGVAVFGTVLRRLRHGEITLSRLAPRQRQRAHWPHPSEQTGYKRKCIVGCVVQFFSFLFHQRSDIPHNIMNVGK